MKTGVELIAEERTRQIEVEGWTAEHDADHLDYELSSVGALYALNLVGSLDSNPQVTANPYYRKIFDKCFSLFYPWSNEWWKPTPNDPVRQLVKAGALIAAEIDRLQRKMAGEMINNGKL